MDIDEAIEFLQRVRKTNTRGLDIFVETYSPGGVGGRPAQKVIGIDVGFDWDHGRIFIKTEKKLTTLSDDEVSAILDSVRKGSSWHAYQREKKYHEEIKQLKAKIKELTEPSI